jgi:hypothetical protein
LDERSCQIGHPVPGCGNQCSAPAVLEARFAKIASGGIPAGDGDLIANQREHHRRLSCQDEYQQILAKYEVEYDERYVWD